MVDWVVEAVVAVEGVVEAVVDGGGHCCWHLWQKCLSGLSWLSLDSLLCFPGGPCGPRGPGGPFGPGPPGNAATAL